MNYQRLSEEFLVAGVVVRDFSPDTDASRRMRKRVGKDAVTRAEFDRVVERARDGTAALAEQLRQRQDAVISEYRDSEAYQQEILELLRPDMLRALASVHDYKQFVQQIRQNLEVLMQSKAGAAVSDVSELVDRASHEERAIYWAVVLMDERLDAALLIQDPTRISVRSNWRRIRLHGLITKYRKIYQRRIESKRLHMHEVGDSYAKIEADPAAVTVIPHALIDNATKYAPEGSDVTLTYREADGRIRWSIASEGPKIAGDERARIFDLFFQGRAARDSAAEGTGFGLGAAQVIAKELGTKITVDQDAVRRPSGFYRTEFTVEFPIAPEREAGPGRRSKSGRRQAR